MNQLQQLLVTAKEKKWCDRLYCTTCGASDYRRAIGSLGFELAGMPVDPRWLKDVRSQLPQEVKIALCKALQEVTKADISRYEFGVGLILFMLELSPHSIFRDPALREVIAGTPVDEYRLNWEEERNRRKYRHPSREEGAERRREKTEARAAAHLKTIAESKERGKLIHAMIARLTSMVPLERLRAIAEDDSIVLPAIPAELILELYDVIPNADSYVLQQLSIKVEGKIPPWNKLSKLINEQL